MSRDLLCYEPGEVERFGYSAARLRLWFLRYIQNTALRRADISVFLTQYAAELVQKSCGKLRRIVLIPHGVGDNFTGAALGRAGYAEDGRQICCLYVSNVAPYKHQWHVVRAIKRLRDKGLDIKLVLTGGNTSSGGLLAQRRLNEEIQASDPRGEFTSHLGFVSQHELPRLFAKADLFVFASSCENMPNTLVEAMAAGIPIACSDRGPMPEVLRDGGLYFNPEDPISISEAIEKLIASPALRYEIARRAMEYSQIYSWTRCAEETYTVLAALAQEKEI